MPQFWVFRGFICYPAKCLSLQVKRLKDLEKEKDVLFCGLEVLEKTRLWYLQRLEGNRARRNFILEAKRQIDCGQLAALEVRD